MSRPPNILVLMDDQHRFDWFGFAGHPVARTPHLDRLASDGVVCTNAYTPAPVCVPARQCLASGRLPRHCGVERYGQDLPPGSETFARALARVGYTTACAGKLHHMGTDPMQGWTRRVCNGDDLQIEPDFLEDRDRDAYARHFQTAAIWPLAEELRRAGPGRSPYAVSDELNVSGACALIEEFFVSPHYRRATPERPLLLKVSLQQPHYPFCAPAAQIDDYLERVAEYPNQHCLDHPAFNNWTRTPPGISADDRRRALAATAAMVEICDAHFGRVLHQLIACGQDLDDWLIVYTSDPGDLLGEHDKWLKHSFYEGSVKVPLLFRAPRLFPGGSRRLDANVSLCDLFATLCDAVGASVPPGLDSRSLLPLLRDAPGARAAWSDEVISQYQGSECMIKRGQLKYQSYGPDRPEVLFDLASDPGETRNQIDAAEHQSALQHFRERRRALGF